MIISHGNARVESGFSINDDILLPNMLEEIIVSHRIVHDAVQSRRPNTSGNYSGNDQNGKEL